MWKIMDRINLNLVRETYGKVVYTYTTHLKEIDIKKKKIGRIKRFNIIWSFVVLFLVFLEIVVECDFVLWFAVSSAFLQNSFLIYQLSFNYPSEVLLHKKIVDQLWFVREKLLCIIADIMNESKTKEEIIEIRDSINKELSGIYKISPKTSNRAYKKAQDSLKTEEEQTFSKEELDLLLPEELRLIKKVDKTK